MKVYQGTEIRNVAVLGHSGCGKTTLMEAAAFLSGATTRMGRIEDGNTLSDYDPEEQRRKVSIGTSIIPIEWKGVKINFLDTPGYFDFCGETYQALAAADVVMIVVSAKAGVEVGVEKAWEYAKEKNLARFIFINGMDDENADFEKVQEDLRALLGSGINIAPFVIPVMSDAKRLGFLHTVLGKAYDFNDKEIVAPPEATEIASEIRASLLESAAENDEALMEKFFEDGNLTDEELNKGLGLGIASGSCVPLMCGAAAKKEGVTLLLDAIANYIPSAAQIRPQIKAKDAKGEEIILKAENGETLCAFVFKTIADPFVGRLSLFRVFSGVIKRDTPLYNSTAEINEKAGHLFIMRGKEQIEATEVCVGDIGAIAKLSGTATQDVLCLKTKPVTMPPIDFPQSLLTLAVVPKGKGDEDKISGAFSKLLEEDKTIKFEINRETKQAVVSGIGDNQLDALVSRLKFRYKIEVELIAPTIPYREMIKSKVKVQGKHKKQSGGRGQYGDVHIEFEPSGDLSKAYIFEEKIFGGSVPRAYFPAVEKGIQECVLAGPLAAYPVVGLKATLVDGSYHDVDSSELAFKLATSIAFKDGFMKAKPTLLEPIVKLAVTVPESYTGDIMGDMNKRRGRIMGMEKVGDKQVISAEAPLAEVLRYSTDLRSMTQGRGSYRMEFDRYEEAPHDAQAKIIETRKKELEALRDNS